MGIAISSYNNLPGNKVQAIDIQFYARLQSNRQIELDRIEERRKL